MWLYLWLSKACLSWASCSFLPPLRQQVLITGFLTTSDIILKYRLKSSSKALATLLIEESSEGSWEAERRSSWSRTLARDRQSSCQRINKDN